MNGVRKLAAAAFFTVATLCLMFSQSSAPGRAAVEPNCRSFYAYYRDACSEAMYRWLPHFDSGADLLAVATQVDRRDDFLYGGEHGVRHLEMDGPDDGLFFLYGLLSQTRAHAVYDYEHRIAFFDIGCCSWHEVVAAAGTAPPPKTVPARNLLGLTTVRGIRLWQTPAEVMHIYGRARSLAVPGAPQLRLLAYTTLPKALRAKIRTARDPAPCEQLENFYFRQNRLVTIQLGTLDC